LEKNLCEPGCIRFLTAANDDSNSALKRAQASFDARLSMHFPVAVAGTKYLLKYLAQINTLDKAR
jgi:hypothetical protein